MINKKDMMIGRIRVLILGALAMMMAIGASGQQVRFHDEANDTLRINTLLAKGLAIDSPNERIAALAEEFIGTPYQAGTLECAAADSVSGEVLTVNLDGLDCTTFVETLTALGITAGEKRSSWRDFIYNLENIRYRKGAIDGYPSRLHYFSDWVVDNAHRGNFEEVTNRFTDVDYEVKTLDFMSRNRDLYPALSDSLTYERMKSAEIGYRNHRYPVIKTKSAAKAAKMFLKEGDIIAITTAKKGLDVSHLGIIKMQKGVPYLLHASSKGGKVMIDPLSFVDYLKRDRNITGFRVIRLKE